MNARCPGLVPLSPRVLALVRAVAAAGGRALCVGGCVRDAILGEPGKDVDLEVHELPADALRGLLKRFGRVDEVGRSFGVFKLRLDGVELDVSLPRVDSKVGTGHRGIRADADPHLGLVEAARRRDLTINAIAWDPLNAELIDPFGGEVDIRERRLRAVDDAHFVEDPLRALRVAQFAARFEAEPVPELEALCRTMALGELPAERVRLEVEKLLLRGKRPSLGWNFAHRAGLWARVLPAWDAPCPPRLDALAALPLHGEGRRFALLLAASAAGPALVDTLDRLRLFAWAGVDVRALTTRLDQARSTWAPGPSTATDARRLAEQVDVELFAALVDAAALHEAAEALGVLHAPLLPLIGGRDLVAIGVAPGPALGQLLAEVREAQLAGHLSSPEDALCWAQARLR